MLQNLKSLREEKNMTQQELASKLNISQQSVNKYENQNTEPDINLLSKMADFFNTSIDYLVGYTNINKKITVAKSCELDSDEEELVEQYRKLSDKSKNIVKTISNMLE